jgi:hypothetical protein
LVDGGQATRQYGQYLQKYRLSLVHDSARRLNNDCTVDISTITVAPKPIETRISEATAAAIKLRTLGRSIAHTTGGCSGKEETQRRFKEKL